MEKKGKDFWYSLDKIRSYNALFNFIILMRGVGKTYSFKKFVVHQAIKNEEHFIYLRRTDVELKDSMHTFMNDLGKEFPQYAFRIFRDKLEYNIPDPDNEGAYLETWKTCGYFAYLSNARRKKSVSYEGVKYMAFDEFIVPPSDKYAKYLPDEVMVFLDFYETVARMRDVQVFFLSNAMSTINPYFLHFGLVLPNTKSGIKRIGKDIVIEYHDQEAYREAKQQTRFGQLIKGTRFEEYAMGNKFITETEDFIQKKSGYLWYEFTLCVEDKNYGVYRRKEDGVYFISDDVDSKVPFRYIYKSTKSGYFSFKNRKSNVNIARLVEAFEYCNVYFESQRIKVEMMGFFERIM